MAKQLTLEHDGNATHDARVWTIFQDGVPVAEIHLDYLDQVREVVLYADASKTVQLEVLRLAASHVKQYVKNRRVPVMGGIMEGEYRNDNLTSFDSQRLMDLAVISPEIKKMDREAIIKALYQLQIDVVVAIYKKYEDSLNSVCAQLGADINYIILPERTIFNDRVLARFFVNDPPKFTFWKSESVPSKNSWDLHIIPHYHPVMMGYKLVSMVNGATDANIDGLAVKTIYCPNEARADLDGRSYGSSWNHVRHPFYATGRSVTLGMITTKLRSAEGVQELLQLLRASLGMDEHYVEVSGGFRAPMKCPHNRLLETGQQSPWPEAGVHRARGSEAHCVWAYRTLQEEGVLKQAHIPSWFFEEDWLGVYKDAEIRPGLY